MFLTRLSRRVGEEFRDRLTLDDVLTTLDEHYNNVKSLDALNQELFQLQIGEKETMSDWGCLLRHLQVLMVSFPEHFPPDHAAELKHDHLYSGLPKWLKAMVAYLKTSINEKMYSNYLQAVREAKKEEAMEPSCSQMADKQTKPKVMSFFPLWKLKGTQPVKTPAVLVAHLKQAGTDKEESAKSDNPNGIEGVTEEFIVHLARAVKEAQQDKKHCHHYGSPEHFICECPLVKASRTATHLNGKEGLAPQKGGQTPQVKGAKPKVPQEGMFKA